jgi:hypothetical protein
VIQDVLGRIFRTRRDDPPPDPDADAAKADPIVSFLDPSIEVCELVEAALESRRLRRCDAELLLSVAIGTDTLRGRADREGVTYAAIHERWRRARQRLKDACAHQEALHVLPMHPRAGRLNTEARGR